jgi:hypothetical protein
MHGDADRNHGFDQRHPPKNIVETTNNHQFYKGQPSNRYSREDGHHSFYCEYHTKPNVTVMGSIEFITGDPSKTHSYDATYP